MSRFQRILCTVDLSDNGNEAIELATALAKHFGAKLVFAYVAPQWLPEEALFNDDFVHVVVAEDKKKFHQIRPTDDDVEFEHLFLNGNPSLEIIRAAKAFDMIVMSTHGHSGIMRLLMGSVARYVLRHATCPVVTFKNTSKNTPAADSEREPKRFVTEMMHDISPIHGFEKMEKVMADLGRARETGAAVVNEMGFCIGILTKSDIDKYKDLKERFEKRDVTVVDEMFEVDEFGQRRAGNADFDQVHRHMTSPVVTIANTESCQNARGLFDLNKGIHHLVVVDDAQHPIGILEAQDLAECETEAS